jgi:hypothetical protein
VFDQVSTEEPRVLQNHPDELRDLYRPGCFKGCFIVIAGIVVALVYGGFVWAAFSQWVIPWLDAHLSKTAAGIVGWTLVIVASSPVILIRKFIQRY